MWKETKVRGLVASNPVFKNKSSYKIFSIQAIMAWGTTIDRFIFEKDIWNIYCLPIWSV